MKKNKIIFCLTFLLFFSFISLFFGFLTIKSCKTQLYFEQQREITEKIKIFKSIKEIMIQFNSLQQKKIPSKEIILNQYNDEYFFYHTNNTDLFKRENKKVNFTNLFPLISNVVNKRIKNELEDLKKQIFKEKITQKHLQYLYKDKKEKLDKLTNNLKEIECYINELTSNKKKIIKISKENLYFF